MDDDAHLWELWEAAERDNDHAIAAICERALDGLVSPCLHTRLCTQPETWKVISVMSMAAARVWCDAWLQIVTKGSLSDEDNQRINELAPWRASGSRDGA